MNVKNYSLFIVLHSKNLGSQTPDILVVHNVLNVKNYFLVKLFPFSSFIVFYSKKSG